jgi:hypothetical protein
MEGPYGALVLGLRDIAKMPLKAVRTPAASLAVTACLGPRRSGECLERRDAGTLVGP